MALLVDVAPAEAGKVVVTPVGTVPPPPVVVVLVVAVAVAEDALPL